MKKYRDIVNPITARDWFLYHLFNDDEFCVIRKQWRDEINDIDSGEPGRSGLPFLEQESITERYVKVLGDKFNITRETARSGLAYDKWNNAFNESRIPTAKIEKDRVLISVGADTRFEDLEHYWSIWVSQLQKQLQKRHTTRDSIPYNPRLGYVIYNELRKGRRMADIHKKYTNGSLDSRIPPNPTKNIEDFRRDYKKIVKSFIKQV